MNPRYSADPTLLWDYATGQEVIRIETVLADEVLDLVAELPLTCEREAEAICNAHNKTVLEGN